MTEWTTTEWLEWIELAEESSIRGRCFGLPKGGSAPGTLYPHQIHALIRMEDGGADPLSGIVHFPTGAGKTRVGLELAARTLGTDPDHRFIWATAHKQLLRQTMLRLVELSSRFPEGTTYAWADDPKSCDSEQFEASILFMTRDGLRTALSVAADGRRSNHPWRRVLDEGGTISLVYDECHQLGAEGLQASWGAFYDKVLKPMTRRRRDRGAWRTIGLSATPLPTSVEAHAFLREAVFPLRADATSAAADWGMHVFTTVRNDDLIHAGVLCNIDLFLDRSGIFDIDASLLSRLVGAARLARPPENAQSSDTGRMQLQQYALQFNRAVMSSEAVVSFLAQRIGAQIATLRKTIVFVPTVEAANLLVSRLYDGFPGLRGYVAVVHSHMAELRFDKQEERTVHEVLAKFRRLGNVPSVLVNVNMLTEGFDDPTIQTVILARLTLSTNRFWQMIGRGTRGRAAGGTDRCIVIDPIKLVRLYGYFDGYQPSFTGAQDVELERGEDGEVPEGGVPGPGAVRPEVPAVLLPPDPRIAVYRVDPNLRAVHNSVAEALARFLGGTGAIGERDAVAVARSVEVAVGSEGPEFVGADEPGFQPTTAMALLLGELTGLEQRSGYELGWLRRAIVASFVKEDPDETDLRLGLRWCRVVEQLGLWTAQAFDDANRAGELTDLLDREARGDGALPAPSNPGNAFTAQEEAVMFVAMAVAAADGTPTDAEVATVAAALTSLFGRTATDEVIRRLRSVPAFEGDLPVTELTGLQPPALRDALVLHLVEIAAADGVVSSPERALISRIAEAMQITGATLRALLGAPAVRTQPVDLRTQPMCAPPHPPSGPSVRGGTSRCCARCFFVVPEGGAFCPGCGAPVPAGSQSQQAPRACAGCAAPAAPDAAFCSRCGLRL